MSIPNRKFIASLRFFSLYDTILGSNFPIFCKPRYKEITVPQPCVFCTRVFPDGAEVLDSTTYFYVIGDSSPVVSGHLRIIPNRHRTTFFDLTAGEWTDFAHILEIAKARLEDRSGPAPKGMFMGTSCIFGKGGSHACFHIVPTLREEAVGPPNWGLPSQSVSQRR